MRGQKGRPAHRKKRMRVAASRRIGLVAATSAVLFCIAAPASAADSTVPTAQATSGADRPGKDAASAKLLPAVTVTARRSEENAKAVPFSISVLNGEQLESRRLLSIEDALRATPGINVNSSGSPNNYNIYVRGVGSLYQMSMDDSAVLFNLDGVSLSPRYASLGTLDVERVEVLKGPQGTLFGGNAEAGAVNIVSRRPTRYLEGYVRGEIGQHGQNLEEAVVSGPLDDRLRGRIAIRQQGENSWVDNTQTGAPLSKPRTLAFRGSLLWNLTPDTSALFIGERQNVKDAPNLLVLRPYGSNPAVSLTPSLLDDERKTMERYSVEVEHPLDNSRITSVTATTRADFKGISYYDQNIYNALYGVSGEFWQRQQSVERVTSEDLRWSSLAHARVFWVAGLNLSHAERSFDTPEDTRGQADASFRNFKTNRYALYGEVTQPLSDALKLTAGLRQSWDERRYDATYADGASDDARSLNDRFTTGRVALSYAITPSTNLYATASHGHNPGGFNDFATQHSDSAPYRSASSNTGEIGFKTESGDRNMVLNGSIFNTQVKDAHLLSFDAATFASRAVNANTRSRGAELEGTYRIIPALTLSGGVSYIDAVITSNVFNTGNGDVLAGNRMPDVSHWNGNVVAAYRRSLPAVMGLSSPVFKAQLAYRYVGKRAADPQNHFDLRGYGKLDARIGVSTGRMETYLWVDNLTNQQYDLYGFYGAPNVTYGAPSRGRSGGVGASFQF